MKLRISKKVRTHFDSDEEEVLAAEEESQTSQTSQTSQNSTSTTTTTEQSESQTQESSGSTSTQTTTQTRILVCREFIQFNPKNQKNYEFITYKHFNGLIFCDYTCRNSFFSKNL